MYPDQTHIGFPEFYVCYEVKSIQHPLRWQQIHANTWRQAEYLFKLGWPEEEVLYVQEYVSNKTTITHFPDGTKERNKSEWQLHSSPNTRKKLYKQTEI